MTFIKKVQIVVKDEELESLIKTLKKAGLAVDNVQDEMDDLGNKTQQAANKGKEAFLNLKSALAGISLGILIKQVIDASAEFQKFSAVLRNTLGSNSAAQKALNDITKFAAQTPFSVSQLTDAFVKLANQGFKPTLKEMRALGDLAASTGKEFDQLAEAIIDAQVGEFERLKEFGIRSKKEGETVTFTFKGVATQVAFTEQAMRAYLLSLGDVAGVSGSMAAISATLGGKISNLGDSVDTLLTTMGEGLPIIGRVIDGFGGLVDMATKLISTPISQKLREEQVEVNGLVRSIITYNDNADVRQRLVNTLISKYPELNEQLNIEKATVGELEESLKKLNAQYLNRIFLARQEEQLAPLLEKLANLRENEETLIQNISKREEGLLETKIEQRGITVDLLERDRFYLEQNRKGQQNIQAEIDKVINKYSGLIDSVDSLDEVTDDAEETVKDLAKALNEIGSPDQLKNVQELRKELEAMFKVYTGEDVGKFSDKLGEEALERVEARVKKEIKVRQDAEEKKRDEFKKTQEFREQLERGYLDLAQSTIEELLIQRLTSNEDYIADVEAKYSKEIGLAGDNAQAQKAIEERRAAELEIARRKQAQQEKQNALTSILIQTALAVARAFADYQYPASLAVAALAGAEGAAQYALVQGYEKGGYTGDGGVHDVAGVVHGREFVVSAPQTRKNRALLDDIMANKIDDKTYKKLMAGGPVVNVSNGINDERIVRAIENQKHPDFVRIGSDIYEIKNKGTNTKQRVRKKVLN